MNKLGMELSVNMMVVLVLAILVFGLGMTIMYKVMTQSEDMTQDVSRQNKEALKALMDSGEKVSVYPSTLNLGKEGVVSVAVRNVLGNEQTFDIEAECHEYSVDETTPGDGCNDLGLEFLDGSSTISLTLENNKEDYKNLLVKTVTESGVAPKGIYAVKVTVTDESDTIYYNPILFYVYVE